MDNNYLPRASRIWKANLAFIRSLLFSKSVYINPEDFERLNIACSDLDLQSGKSSDGSDVFITPFPQKKLHALLDESRPSTLPDLSENLDGINVYDALGVTHAISDYVHLSESDDRAGIMWEQTTWRTRGRHGMGRRRTPNTV
ncbi:hypothetical protein F5Y09DRAFT_346924 [Xylaria sp. FL1042]|nr:hypothetical protein F5Y09DRAFT_346924 [Xylaria sp. FL1042]